MKRTKSRAYEQKVTFQFSESIWSILQILYKLMAKGEIFRSVSQIYETMWHDP